MTARIVRFTIVQIQTNPASLKPGEHARACSPNQWGYPTRIEAKGVIEELRATSYAAEKELNWEQVDEGTSRARDHDLDCLWYVFTIRTDVEVG